jgi:hypothetical protein
MRVTFKSRPQVTVDRLSAMSHPIRIGGTAADNIPTAASPAGRHHQKVPRAGDEASAFRISRSAKVALPYGVRSSFRVCRQQSDLSPYNRSQDCPLKANRPVNPVWRTYLAHGVHSRGGRRGAIVFDAAAPRYWATSFICPARSGAAGRPISVRVPRRLLHHLEVVGRLNRVSPGKLRGYQPATMSYASK